MSTYPTKAGTGGPVFVADRNGVAANLTLNAQTFAQRKKHILDNFVIFSPLRVCSHTITPVGIRGTVCTHTTNDALRTLNKQAGIHALIDIALHIAKVTMPAASQPFAQRIFIVGKHVGTGNAASVEADLDSNSLYLFPANHSPLYLAFLLPS